MLLVLALCLGLLPTGALAAEKPLPDWYFLFAVFKNLDADVKDGNGKTQHAICTRGQIVTFLHRSLAK